MTQQRMLPPGWRWVRLAEVCEFIRGVSFDKAEVRMNSFPGYLPILRAGNIGETLDLENDLVWVPQRYISSHQLLRVGDIAVCMSSGSPDVVGKTSQLKQQWVGSVGAFCGIIRPRNDNLTDYLGLWFRSPEFSAWRDEQARGANIQNLRFSKFETVEIPVPPPNEQKRIAAILNEQMAAVERARAAAEAQLQAAKALPAAYLCAVFESPEAQRWPRMRFEEVAVLQRGYDLPSQEQVPGEYPIMTSSGLSGTHSQYKARGPGVITGRSGSIGKVYFVDKDYWPHNTALYVKNFNGNEPRYIFFLLQWLDLNVLRSGSGVPTLDRKAVHCLIVPHPDREKQIRIAVLLTGQMAAAEKTHKALEAQLSSINALPAVFLRRAFSGEL